MTDGNAQVYRYFYPRSPCGERLANIYETVNRNRISIHALLAESDQCRSRKTGRPLLFLSTLSLRRATPRSCPASSPRRYFYPRSPCGERPFTMPDLCQRYVRISIHALLAESDPLQPSGQYDGLISIHALLAESDSFIMPSAPGLLLFLSTLSLRRATAKINYKRGYKNISIHALLAESDN